MSKAVLISINPNWCDFIKNGIKTVEVRKSRPKLDVPFKVYIYCTIHGCSFLVGGKHPLSGNGMVVGEFICDWITGVKCDNAGQAAYNRKHDTCLSDEEIMKYANNGKLYYWHISDLKIYDRPRELGEFFRYDKPNICTELICEHCAHWKYMPVNSNEYDYDCDCHRMLDNPIPLRRPPQSWQYVEGREE